MALNAQSRYNAEQEARNIVSIYTDEELAVALLASAEQPRRHSPSMNKAIRYEAALRIRKYSALLDGGKYHTIE